MKDFQESLINVRLSLESILKKTVIEQEFNKKNWVVQHNNYYVNKMFNSFHFYLYLVDIINGMVKLHGLLTLTNKSKISTGITCWLEKEISKIIH